MKVLPTVKKYVPYSDDSFEFAGMRLRVGDTLKMRGSPGWSAIVLKHTPAPYPVLRFRADSGMIHNVSPRTFIDVDIYKA